MFDTINSFEIGILDWIQDFMGNSFFDALFTFITKLGDKGYLWIGIGVILLFFKKTRKSGILVLVALLVEWIVCNGILKNLFDRVRPYDFVGEYELLIPKLSSFSFPSGHTMSSAVAATMLTLCDKRFGWFAIPIAVLIAFSRLYLYVHYPSDVIVAALAGVLLALAVFYINKNLIEPKLKSLKS